MGTDVWGKGLASPRLRREVIQDQPVGRAAHCLARDAPDAHLWPGFGGGIGIGRWASCLSGRAGESGRRHEGDVDSGVRGTGFFWNDAFVHSQIGHDRRLWNSLLAAAANSCFSQLEEIGAQRGEKAKRCSRD